MLKVPHYHPFAVPGDHGTGYLEWGAVPKCLRGEVTGPVCTAYRKHASSGTPDASRQTFPGWQWSPTSSSSSSPRDPRPAPPPTAGFSPHIRSRPGIGMPAVPRHPRLPPLPPKDPGPPGDKATLPSKAPSSPTGFWDPAGRGSPT